MKSVEYSISFRQTAFCFLIVFATYVAINFILTPNVFFPVHQDDYVLLGLDRNVLGLFIERPVAVSLTYFIGLLSEDSLFYAVSFLTVTFPMLTILFFSVLFGVRFHWAIIIFFAVMSFSHSSSFEDGKYLGSIGMWSLFFGTISLIFIALAYKTRRAIDIAFALVAYFLSAFAKEDFLLPPLILFAGLALLYLRERGLYDRLMIGGGCLAICIAGLSVAHSISVNSRFAGLMRHANGGAYDVTFNPQVLASLFAKLTIDYIPVETFLAVLAFLVCLFIMPGRRILVAVAGIILVSLVAPYSLIPNNIISYRVFGWLPWMAALVALALQVLCDQAVAKPRIRWVVIAVAVLGAIGLYRVHTPERQAFAEWYLRTQDIHRSMISTIEKYRDRITSVKEVGIVGLKYLSPWSNNSAAYLHKWKGFSNHWILFVEWPSLFYQAEFSGRNREVRLVSPTEVCKHESLLVVRFDEQGKGDLVQAADLCR